MSTRNKADVEEESSNPNQLDDDGDGTAVGTDSAESFVKQRFIAEYKHSRKPGVEHIQSCEPPQSSMATVDGPLTKSDLSKQSTAAVRLVTIQDNDGPPSPFSSVEFDDRLQKKKIIKSNKNYLTSSTLIGNRSQSAPASASTRIEQNTAINIRQVVNDEEELPSTSDVVGDSFNTGGYVRKSSDSPVDRDDPILIPEAVLVEDEERGRHDNIIISGYAEPVIPFWKQTSTRVFACVIMLLTIAFATTLAILFIQQGDQQGNYSPTDETSLIYEPNVPTPMPSDFNDAMNDDTISIAWVPPATPIPSSSSSPSAPTVSPAPSVSPIEEDVIEAMISDSETEEDVAEPEIAAMISAGEAPAEDEDLAYDEGPDIGILLLIIFGSLLVLTCIGFGVFARKKGRQMQQHVNGPASA